MDMGPRYYALSTEQCEPASMPPTVSLTTPQAAVQIARGNYSWSAGLGQEPTPVTYGFRASRPPESYGDGEAASFAQVNDAERTAFIKAIKEWQSIANITFTPVDVDQDKFTDQATILIANWTDPKKSASAHAYYPGDKPFSGDRAFASKYGDVWLDLAYDKYVDFTPGEFNYQTVMHELGHALGLQHPGDYNSGESETGVIYERDAAYIQDSRQYSLMSYLEAYNTYANHVVETTDANQVVTKYTYYAVTPLLDDIAAIQRLYGANMTTRVGNTTYGFNSNADDSAYHMDGDKQAVFSIWDAGGINTLDFSGYSTNQRLDLRQGEFSNAGVLTKNISIALGAIIQNGIGGQGNDTIIGNDSDNELTGNKGNDGIDGGAGRNVAIYSGAMKNYALTFSGAPSTVGSTFTVKDNAGTDGTDALTNVQELRFIDQTMSTTDFLLASGLKEGSFDQLLDLYIVEENRAPDALGLMYWAARLAEGVPLQQIADSFFAQPETATVYSPTLSNREFVVAAYQTVFKRNPDDGGLAYWEKTLDDGAISRGWFLYSFLSGAVKESNDYKIATNKEKVAYDFALTQGLSNPGWGQTVMLGVDETAESVTAADQQIKAFAAAAADPATAELVVKLVGIQAGDTTGS